jgi:nucleoside-diphosphate-sugar epimerase
MTKKIVALVGGSGHLGTLIATALLEKQDVQLRLLVRAGSRGKVAEFEKRGAQIVEGTLGPEDGAALASLCNGAFAVISAVQGGPDVIIEGQRRLLHAARDAGVRRFIASDYSLDLFKVKPGNIITSEMRRQFALIEEQERGDVEVVHVLNGGFLDRGVLFGFIRLIDVEKQTAYVWGDGQQPMDWTTYEDTARYTAEAAVDDRPVPRKLNVAGSVVDFAQLVQEYEAGSGKKLKIERLGSLDDLSARISELQKANPQNLLAYLPLMYLRSVLTGEGKLEPLMNDRYPSIRPATIREYVAKEGL